MTFLIYASKPGQITRHVVGNGLSEEATAAALKAVKVLGGSAWAYEEGQRHPIYYTTPVSERLPRG